MTLTARTYAVDLQVGHVIDGGRWRVIEKHPGPMPVMVLKARNGVTRSVPISYAMATERQVADEDERAEAERLFECRYRHMVEAIDRTFR